jgi:hypothetical protein
MVKGCPPHAATRSALRAAEKVRMGRVQGWLMGMLPKPSRLTRWAKSLTQKLLALTLAP